MIFADLEGLLMPLATDAPRTRRPEGVLEVRPEMVRPGVPVIAPGVDAPREGDAVPLTGVANSSSSFSSLPDDARVKPEKSPFGKVPSAQYDG